jgi:hypothetical protein
VPVLSRTTLRQKLGRDYLHDTTVSTLTATSAAVGATVFIIDTTMQDPQLAGENMYQRAWIKCGQYSWRIASFNCYSGAFIGSTPAQNTPVPTAEYEVHELISPDDKDRALDEVASMLKFRQEVSVAGVANMQVYAVPDHVVDVYGVRYADSNASARTYSDFASWGLAMTGSGREIRVSAAITASQNLVIDALVNATLPSSATIWFPSDDWILSGAAARIYWMLEAKSPGQQAATYRLRRQELTRRFNSLQQYYRPQINEPIRMED